nr:ribonuclease H-like domain-containing protein [Tanacetum cinerariifolium]
VLGIKCFNCHKMGHFARECRAPRNQERGRRDSYIQGSKAEEQTPKELMAIDGVGWDWSCMANDEEDHALVAEAPIEFALMANTTTENKELEILKQEKEVVDGKLAGLLSASKNLDNLIESQRSDKSKEGLRYTAVPPPVAQLYLSPKKDLSWTGLPECANDTITDYSRPSPTLESSSEEDQNRNPSASENVASPITPKQFVKFVKASDSQSKSKTDEKETPEKPSVKNAEQCRKPNKKPNVRGNQRIWNNLKSHQLGPDFVMKKKACFNCGNFNHLAYECRKKVKRGTTRSQNNTYTSSSQRPVVHRPNRYPMRSMRPNMNCACSNRTPFNKFAQSYSNRPFQRKSTVRSQYRAPWVLTVNRNFPPVNRKISIGSRNFPTVNKKLSTASRKFLTGSTKGPTVDMGMKGKAIKPSAAVPGIILMTKDIGTVAALGT